MKKLVFLKENFALGQFPMKKNKYCLLLDIKDVFGSIDLNCLKWFVGNYLHFHGLSINFNFIHYADFNL